MAESDAIACVEAQVLQPNAQLKEVVEILTIFAGLLLDSRLHTELQSMESLQNHPYPYPTFAESSLELFAEALSKI